MHMHKFFYLLPLFHFLLIIVSFPSNIFRGTLNNKGCISPMHLWTENTPLKLMVSILQFLFQDLLDHSGQEVIIKLEVVS